MIIRLLEGLWKINIEWINEVWMSVSCIFFFTFWDSFVYLSFVNVR